MELWGDSLSGQATHYIAFALGASGRVTPKLRTFPGTALCDWLPDMRAELNAANQDAFRPQAVIIQFTGDAFTSCMHDPNGVPYQGQAMIAKYESDAAAVVSLFSAARVPVYFASSPLTRADATKGDVGVTPLGRMFSRLPARFPAGHLVRYIDASAPLLWHGHYARTLPCLAGEPCTGRWPDGKRTVVVRQADGGHFCPVVETGPVEAGHHTCPVYMGGARRFAIALAGPVLRDFRMS